MTLALDLAEAQHAFFFLLLSDQDPPMTLEELVGPRPAWQTHAACRGMGVDLFFPALGESTEPARAICARCEVSQECIDYVMDAESGAPGVWGARPGRTGAGSRGRAPRSCNSRAIVKWECVPLGAARCRSK